MTKSSKIVSGIITLVLFVFAYHEWQTGDLGYALALALGGILFIGVTAKV